MNFLVLDSIVHSCVNSFPFCFRKIPQRWIFSQWIVFVLGATVWQGLVHKIRRQWETNPLTRCLFISFPWRPLIIILFAIFVLILPTSQGLTFIIPMKLHASYFAHKKHIFKGVFMHLFSIPDKLTLLLSSCLFYRPFLYTSLFTLTGI